MPTGGWGFAWGAGPNWDDALFECAYQIYRYTGDTKVILDNIDAMEKYLHYMQTKKNEDGLFLYGLGDWCQPGDSYRFTTTEELVLTDSIKCIDICKKTSKMAKVIGREDLANWADELALSIHTAFCAKYLKDGRSIVEKQTPIAYILYYQIAEEYKDSLQKQLLEVIARDGEVFTTGVLGARTLFRVLSDMGESDLAYKLIVQPKFPSYGVHVLRGARTLLENFYELKEDSWECKNGRKQDSLNHHFWGDISAWMISYVAGIKINPDFYALDQVEISPQFVLALDYAEGKFMHRKGEIVSRWDRTAEDEIQLSITLPKGVEATLKLPSGYACEGAKLCEGKQRIAITKNKQN